MKLYNEFIFIDEIRNIGQNDTNKNPLEGLNANCLRDQNKFA